MLQKRAEPVLRNLHISTSAAAHLDPNVHQPCSPDILISLAVSWVAVFRKIKSDIFAKAKTRPKCSSAQAARTS